MVKYTMRKEAGLYRITAKRNFGRVTKGMKGGLIAYPENLSHDGDCWVGEDARVVGDARVLDNAVVNGRAFISGYAKICGGSLVQDCGCVCDTAVVSGRAVVFQHAKINDRAQITESAVVCGYAEIGGDARLSGNPRCSGECIIAGSAHITGTAAVGNSMNILSGLIDRSPIYIQGSHYPVYWPGQNGYIRSGCMLRPVEWWDSQLAFVARSNGYSEIEVKEYEMHFKLVKDWMATYDKL